MAKVCRGRGVDTVRIVISWFTVEIKFSRRRWGRWDSYDKHWNIWFKFILKIAGPLKKINLFIWTSFPFECVNYFRLYFEIILYLVSVDILRSPYK